MLGPPRPSTRQRPQTERISLSGTPWGHRAEEGEAPCCPAAPAPAPPAPPAPTDRTRRRRRPLLTCSAGVPSSAASGSQSRSPSPSPSRPPAPRAALAIAAQQRRRPLGASRRQRGRSARRLRPGPGQLVRGGWAQPLPPPFAHTRPRPGRSEGSPGRVAPGGHGRARHTRHRLIRPPRGHRANAGAQSWRSGSRAALGAVPSRAWLLPRGCPVGWDGRRPSFNQCLSRQPATGRHGAASAERRVLRRGCCTDGLARRPRSAASRPQTCRRVQAVPGGRRAPSALSLPAARLLHLV